MITVEVKNGSASQAAARGYGVSSKQEEKKMETSLSSNEIRQEALDRFLVKVVQKERVNR
jgi:hypothetical protein